MSAEFPLPPLLLTAIWSLLPTSRHHAYVCSAGSQGYHALKEMLQSGVPGNTLLLESGDLRDVVVVGSPCPTATCCCQVYTFPAKTYPPQPDLHHARGVFIYNLHYPGHIPLSVTHVIIYSNQRELPPQILSRCQHVLSVNLSHLSGVSSISGLFLSGCTHLRKLDLSPLANVKEVQGS